jgi:hypothetical protein
VCYYYYGCCFGSYSTRDAVDGIFPMAVEELLRRLGC